MSKTVGSIEVEVGAIPEKHELLTANFLAGIGYKILFLAPNRSKGSKTPDINMNNLLWEIKSPKGNSSRVIENNLRYAVKQSNNVIFDLRRLNNHIAQKSVIKLKFEFKRTTNLKNLIIITKSGKYIDLIK